MDKTASWSQEGRFNPNPEQEGTLYSAWQYCRLLCFCPFALCFLCFFVLCTVPFALCWPSPGPGSHCLASPCIAPHCVASHCVASHCLCLCLGFGLCLAFAPRCAADADADADALLLLCMALCSMAFAFAVAFVVAFAFAFDFSFAFAFCWNGFKVLSSECKLHSLRVRLFPRAPTSKVSWLLVFWRKRGCQPFGPLAPPWWLKAFFLVASCANTMHTASARTSAKLKDSSKA